MIWRTFLQVFVALVVLVAAVSAQSPFSPVILVDDATVTEYELTQRIRFLELLGQPGDIAEEAENRLIEERLQVAAARDAGIEATEDLVGAGVDEFAARLQLDRAGLVAALNRGGVDVETLRDFVAAGVVWRELVQSRFGPSIRISEEEIERAALATGQSGGVRVLLSEIILPARNPEELAASQARARSLTGIRSFSEFAETARRVSASATRNRGGRLDWLPLQNVPEQVRAQVLGLKPGETTEPIRAQNAVAIFQLRAIEEVGTTEAQDLAIDYAIYRPATGADLSATVNGLDVCDDLYGFAKGQPEERLFRDTVAMSDIPADLALELARLDDNEFLLRGSPDDGARSILMLCGRVRDIADGAEVDRGQIANQLRNQRLTSLASEFLAELEANAQIVRVGQ